MPTEVKISSCQQFVKFIFIICRVNIRHKIWQKQHHFVLLLKTDTENIHIPPNEDWKFLGEEHPREMYEMYEVKLVFHRCSGFYQEKNPFHGWGTCMDILWISTILTTSYDTILRSVNLFIFTIFNIYSLCQLLQGAEGASITDTIGMNLFQVVLDAYFKMTK